MKRHHTFFINIITGFISIIGSLTLLHYLTSCSKDVNSSSNSSISDSSTSEEEKVFAEVTFYLNNESAENYSISIKVGNPITLTNTLTKEGYQFGGWYQDASCTIPFAGDTKIYDDISLYVKWIKKYNVTIFAQDGTSVTSTYLDGDILTLDDKTIEGYEFQGWYLDQNLTIPFINNSIISSDLTIYPMYTKNIKVMFVSDDDNVVLPDDLTLKINDTLDNLPRASKEGYTFLGWSTNNDNIVNVDDTFVLSNNEDITLYPCFSFDGVSVDFIYSNDNHHEIIKYESGAEIALYNYFAIDDNGLVTTKFIDSDNNVYDASDTITITKSLTINIIYENSIYDLTYNNSGTSWKTKGLIINGLKEKDETLETLVIPDTLYGIKVTRIEANAFKDYTSIKSISIGKYVTSIQDYAFQNTSITEIYIPDNVNKIGKGVFAGCKDLVSMDLPFVGKDGQISNDGSSVFAYIFGDTYFDGCYEYQAKVATSHPTTTEYGTYETRTLYTPSSLEKVNIRGGLLDYYAFFQTNIKEVTLHNISDTAEDLFAYSYVEKIDFSDTQLKELHKYTCDLAYALKEVILPNTIEKIGYGAFSNCKMLDKINMPTNLTYIDAYAFCACYSLTSIIIPENVTTINYGAFLSCTSLKDVTLSNNLQYIGMQAFESTAIEEITIPNSVYDIRSRAFFSCTSLNKVILPSSLENFGEYVFAYCYSLEEVTFQGNRLTTIPSYAFYSCYSLKVCEIPQEVTSIGSNAFYKCGLTSIYIPENVLVLGEGVFTYSPNLKEVFFAENCKITTLSKQVFKGCSSLLYFEVPSSITTIEEEAFLDCGSLRMLYIPSTVININGSICYASSKISIASNLSSKPNTWDSNWNSGEYPCYFYGTDVLKDGNFYYILVDDSIKIIRYIGEEDNVIIPSSINGIDVTIIGEYAFNYCTAKTITFGDHITTILEGAFRDVQKAENIYLNEGLKTIKAGAFQRCYKLQKLQIPASVETIEKGAFALVSSAIGFTTLTSRPSGWDTTIPSQFASFTYGLDGSNILKYDVFYYIDNGDHITIYQVESAHYDQLIVPSTIDDKPVTEFNKSSFNGVQGNYVFIPKNVTTFNDVVFSGLSVTLAFEASQESCTFSLNNISSSNRDLTSIYYSASNPIYDETYSLYYFTSSVGSVIIKSTLEDNIVIPNKLSSLDVYALSAECFYNLTTLTSLTLPNTIQAFGYNCFYYNTSLVNLYYQGDIASWCSIDIPSSTSVPFGASSKLSHHFYMINKENQYEEITSITIPEGVTTLTSYTFAGFDNVTSFSTPSSLTSIQAYAFQNCKNIESFYYSTSITNCYMNAFNSCTIKNVYYGGSIESWNKITFERESSTPLYSKGKMYYLSNNAYIEAKDIILDDSLTSITKYAFYGWSNLESIILPSNITTLEGYTFGYCTSLKTITIPTSVNSIGAYTFDGCSALESIVLPTSITKIESSTFNNCKALSTIYYLGNETQYNNITIGKKNTYFEKATVYYYSESEETNGNYFHFDENGVIQVW